MLSTGFKQCVIVGLFVAIGAETAFAQIAKQNDFCKNAAKGAPGSFIATSAGERLSGIDIPLIRNEITASGSQQVRVCIAVPPTEHVRSGVINIRYQIFSSSKQEAMSDQVELENTRSRARLPSVSISAYQDFHQCADQKNSILETEFHESIGAAKTSDREFRKSFSFEKDVPGACNIVGAFLEFFGLIPVVGPVAGAIVGPAFAGPLGLEANKIIGRRSVIVRYAVPDTAADIQYVLRDLISLSLGQCIRVESTDVASLNINQMIPIIRAPLVLGSGCIVKAK